MSLLPDATYGLPSDSIPSHQHSQQPHSQFNPVMQTAMGQQQYMMSPPSALPSTVFHPMHSSVASTSSPITPSSFPSPSFAVPTAPSSSAGPLKRRRFSGAKIQPTRIKKVMQADDEIGRMVASVPVAVGRSMEHFASQFLLSSAQIVASTGARTLAPHHLKLAMLATPHFAFLEPILREVGVPARAGEAYQFPQQATMPQISQQQAQPIKVDGIDQIPHSNMYLDAPSMIPTALPSLMGAQINQYAMHNPYLMQLQQQQQLQYDPLLAMGQMGQLMGGLGGGGNVPYEQRPTLISPATSSPLTSPTVPPPPPAPRVIRRSSSTVSNGEGEGGKKPRGRPRKNKKEKCVEDDLVIDSNMSDMGILKPPSPGDIQKESNEADRLLMPPPPLFPIKPPQ